MYKNNELGINGRIHNAIINIESIVVSYYGIKMNNSFSSSFTQLIEVGQ